MGRSPGPTVGSSSVASALPHASAPSSQASVGAVVPTTPIAATVGSSALSVKSGRRIVFEMPAALAPKSEGRRHADPTSVGSNLSLVIQPPAKRFSLNKLHRKKSLDAYKAAFERSTRPKSFGFNPPPYEPKPRVLPTSDAERYLPENNKALPQRRHYDPRPTTAAAGGTITTGGRFVVAPWDK